MKTTLTKCQHFRKAAVFEDSVRSSESPPLYLQRSEIFLKQQSEMQQET